MRAFILFLMFPLLASGAGFEKKKPVKLIELNEKTLLQNVWPGMTTTQVVQILGDPEESLEVLHSRGSSAVRYGIYWLIPQTNGIQVQCIINQRGLITYQGKVVRCGDLPKKYKLSSQ